MRIPCSPARVCVHMSPPRGPSSTRRPPSTDVHRASECIQRLFGTRLRECVACSVYSPLALLIRGGPSLSAPHCVQCNAIGLHLHLHPQDRTLHGLLHFACASPASPASPHLPAHLSDVSPFSSVPRLAHFAEKDSLFRDTRQSLACRTHAPRTTNREHTRP